MTLCIVRMERTKFETYVEHVKCEITCEMYILHVLCTFYVYHGRCTSATYNDILNIRITCIMYILHVITYVPQVTLQMVFFPCRFATYKSLTIFFLDFKLMLENLRTLGSYPTMETNQGVQH